MKMNEITQITQLQALVARQRAMLEELANDSVCPLCASWPHVPDCALAALLAEGRTETGAATPASEETRG